MVRPKTRWAKCRSVLRVMNVSSPLGRCSEVSEADTEAGAILYSDERRGSSKRAEGPVYHVPVRPAGKGF